MSLINEALKKAQKMRNEPQPGGPAAQPVQENAPLPAPRPVPPPRPAASAEGGKGYSGRSVLLLAGGAGLLTAVCILATVLVLRRDPATGPRLEPVDSARPPVAAASEPSLVHKEAAASPVSPGPVPAPVSAPQPAPFAPVAERTPAPASPVAAAQDQGPVISLPVLAAAKPAPQALPSPVSAVPQAPSAQPAPSQSPAATEQAATLLSPTPSRPATTAVAGDQPLIQLPTALGGAPLAELSEEQRLQQWLSQARIAGIRPGIKVLLNGKAYKPGDMVEPILGLRLVEIAGDHLVFSDRSGARHRRGF